MTLLLETDPSTASTLRAVTGIHTDVVDSVAAVTAQLLSGRHDLVVVGPDVDAAAAFQIATDQRAAASVVGVVLLRRRVTTALLREAMLAGVREVVPMDDLPLLTEACQRSRQVTRQLQQAGTGPSPAVSENGQVVTVFAGKGGCGKTTMATNLAAAFNSQGRRTCIVDLDLAFGDVAIAMQLTPVRTIADAVGLSTLDESAVRSLVTTHDSGLDAILAPVEPGAVEGIPSTMIANLLAVLRSLYDVVVIDSPPAFTDHVLAAFDSSDHFVLLATLDVPAVKNLKLTLETLDMLAYPKDKCHVVLNRSDAKVGLSSRDVERTLRTRISAEVPSSRAVPAAINRGLPIVLDQPGHPVSAAIRQFAQTLPGVLDQRPAVAGRRGFSLRRKVGVAS